MSKTALRNVIWAVDAFDDPDRLRSMAPVALNSLARQGPSKITPVYVLSPGEINIPIDFSGPWLMQYREAAYKALEQALHGIRISGLEDPEVVVENTTSTTQAAHALSNYASDAGADLILVTSHGRKGIGRFLMGSFAEALLQKTRVPVYVLRPNMRIPTRIRSILVPTQFGPRSKSVFRRIVALARDFEARIILFHAVPHPVEPILQSGAYLIGGAWIPVQAYFSEETDRRRRRAEAWARWADHQGVKVEVLIDAQGADVGESITYLAESRKADLIAMESRTGPIASVLIGSVTRHVIRSAHCPVWVLRAVASEARKAGRRGFRRAA